MHELLSFHTHLIACSSNTCSRYRVDEPARMLSYQPQTLVSRRRRDEKDHIQLMLTQPRFKLAGLFRREICNENSINSRITHCLRQTLQAKLKQWIVIAEQNDRRIDLLSRARRGVQNVL